MKRGTLVFQLILLAVILAGVPTALFYYYDSKRAIQMEVMKSKVLSVENRKDIAIIRDNISAKLNKLSGIAREFSPAGVKRRYSSITGNRIIRNFSYSKRSSKRKIASEFSKYADKSKADIALLYINGSVLDTNNPALKSRSFSRNSRFIKARTSKKPISKIDFSSGTAEYFMPIMDIKNRLVSVLYTAENIAVEADRIREAKQSRRGLNFIADSAGRVLLSSDRRREDSENVLLNADIKSILETRENNTGIKEITYNKLKGIIGYNKISGTDFFLFVFTPYIDYEFMQRPAGKYKSSLLDDSLFVPVYAIIGGAFLLCLFIIIGISGGPYRPLRKIARAVTHIDEDSFETLLPKIKKGQYKRVIDALLILKGRVKAAEDKSKKLSGMSKELEEELSKEASRSDAEISELRDAVKIAENNKAEAEENAAREKQEKEDIKKELAQKLEKEKVLLNQKIKTLDNENAKLKEEAKKAGEARVPDERENMRTESILMMNTELKGVLSVIKTYISSVLGGEGKITDAQQQFLGVVINKSARLERLINDLTELAKLEKGEIQLKKAKVDINTVVQDIIFAIQPQADIKKVDLKVDFAPSIPTCTGDSSRLSGIVTQLLNQAIKVSPRGGRVKVETKDKEKEALIKITDFGMSMPKSKAEALFFNFHGGESPAGPEFVNTGLRFPIIKAVVENMGGSVKIESEIGKGKTFVITLPKQGTAPVKPGGAAGQSSVKPGGAFGTGPSKSGPAAGGGPEKPGGPSGPGSGPAKPGGAFGTGPSKPKPEDKEKPKQEPPSTGPKIQRNVMTDIPMESSGTPGGAPSAKAPEEKKPEEKSEDVPKVSDLLSFEEKKKEGPEKKDMPGKDVEVPPDLMEKKSGPREEKKPQEGTAPPAGGSLRVEPEKKEKPEDKDTEKKEPETPGELPPLPDLEDDKGTDII